MGNAYDQIATVDISIDTSVAESESADNILIIGPMPKYPSEDMSTGCTYYKNLADVAAAGWRTDGDDAEPVGIAARVAFAQSPAPEKIYIAPMQETDGTTEYAVDTLDRALGVAGWYLVCPAGVDTDEVKAMADYIEMQEKMMVYTELGFFDDEDMRPTLNEGYMRTCAIYGRENSSQKLVDVPVENLYMNAAFAVAWLANESGSETAAFKELKEVSPGEFNSSEIDSLKVNSVNYLSTVGKKNVTMVGKVLGGEWCDIIRFRDWLKSDMQVAVANLFMDLPKVPYTDGGITLIQNAMEASLKRGQDIGGIAESEFDDNGVENPGYVLSVPRLLDVSDEDKAQRVLRNCTFKARLTGAIHFAEITGCLSYSL